MLTPESPVETFKRATALAIKAIGHKAELEVGFPAEPIGVPGSRVRVPLPSAGLPRTEVGFIRGAADAVALRLRHHDAKLFSKQIPSNAVARTVFEALEQARCEGLGAQDMAGVAANLGSLLDERCKAQGFARAGAKAEVPLADVMRILAFEAFAHQPLPKSAQRAAEIWRPWVEEKLGPHLGRLPELLHDQKAYAGEVLRILKELDMEMPGSEKPDDGESEDVENPAGIDPEDQKKAQSESDSEEGQPDAGAAGEAATDEQGAEEKQDGQPTAGNQDGEEAHHGRNQQREDWDFDQGPRTTYRVFTTQFDEVVGAKDLCPSEEL